MIVFRRELRTLVTSPQAWAIATAYLIISGLFFVTLLFSHPYADLERYYSNIETTLIVVAPIMAMRSFAEERRTGALDITLSWPVSRWTLVAGKWVANTVFTWGMVSIAWLYIYLLHTLGQAELDFGRHGRTTDVREVLFLDLDFALQRRHQSQPLSLPDRPGARRW